MKLDMPKLGAGLLASSAVIKSLVPYEWAWWIALAFAAVSPFLIACKLERKSKHE